MSELSDTRKKLWDYLKAEGIEITATQHDHIRDIMKEYAATHAVVVQEKLDAMIAAAAKRKEESRKRHEAMKLGAQKKFEERQARREAAKFHGSGNTAPENPYV